MRSEEVAEWVWVRIQGSTIHKCKGKCFFYWESKIPPSRNESALSESHQARVTRDLQHDSACCEPRGKSVYDANKMSQ